MKDDLIDLTKIHRINRQSRTAIKDIIDGEDCDTLQEHRIKQSPSDSASCATSTSSLSGWI